MHSKRAMTAFEVTQFYNWLTEYEARLITQTKGQSPSIEDAELGFDAGEVFAVQLIKQIFEATL